MQIQRKSKKFKGQAEAELCQAQHMAWFGFDLIGFVWFE